jgi:diguanylate cyclase (GGDEF)-like protein
MASLCLFMGLSRHPNVIHYYSGISVILMFSNMILRQPFAYALGVSLGGCLLYLLTLPHIPSMPSDSAISSIMVIVTSALFSLIGNFQTNYEHRRDFLMNALQQISGRKLSRMNSQLERLSLTDGLTGLANRRQFDLTLQREWHAAQRNRYPLTLVFLDVDHFKNYNDNYGHPAGDIVLRRIGAVLTMVSKRAQDLLARYGGEEFVVLLPQTDPEHGCLLAEGIRQDVQALGIPHDYSEAADVVTVSLGVASLLPDRQCHPEDLLSQADQALYEAKQSGRNRVVVAARER